MKKIAIVTILLLLIGPLAWSIEKAPPASSGVVDAGNKFCPVSGDKVSGKHFVEYNGKKYGLCCPMCANKFKKDPAKYLAKMAAQEANPKVASAHKGHEHMDM